MRFNARDPGIGFVGNNLLLPKQHVNVDAIKNVLTFVVGEEDIVDETDGEVLGTQTRTLEVWDETSHHLIVPREFLTPQQLAEFEFPVVDERPTSFPYVDVGCTATPKPDQIEPMRVLLEARSGTLNIKCGGGKSVIALMVIGELHGPGLIVVNTTALLEQWVKEIRTHTNVQNPGIIQGQTSNWRGKPIVVAMVHTLSNRPEYLTREFGSYFAATFYDEGHHMSAPVFVRSADACLGRRYSLTATPQRTDGLEMIYQAHLGRVIYRDLEQELIPNTIFHALYWEMPDKDMDKIEDSSGEVNMSRVRTYLGQLRWRNDIILDMLEEDLKDGRTILALSHSVAQVETLADLAPWREAGMIYGKTAQAERMDLLANSNPLFGTAQLAREGLDKPPLDTLYVLTPFANSNDLQQMWGRIQREYDGKRPPLVRVFEDANIDACLKACRRLRKFLTGLKYPKRRLRQEVDLGT
jgi:superfamily II DNA or RNA helicase